MRAGGACAAAQQTLSAEAASVLKHSLSLARRRGHAQVTPLHVAATLLASRTSLLRRACLNSQSPVPHPPPPHPLQCRALELCFNVALNRLPATPAPLLHHAQPSLSNALVAALKRAQAHQRRGCIEQQQQQQPLVAIKVELEQLILSILDDPSVSRVMREAGFSSTAVKSNLEDAANSVSSVFQCYDINTPGGIYSTPSSPPSHRDQYHHHVVINPNSSFLHSHLLSQNPFLFSPPKKPIGDSCSFKEDINVVFEVLLGKKRRNNIVIVGDCLSMAEGLVVELMKKVERGDDVPEELKSANFIKFQFSSCAPLRFMKKEEVEMNIADLKRKVDAFTLSPGVEGKSVIIYTGDLKWTVDNDDDYQREGGFSSGGKEEEGATNVYRAVDHLIEEIGKLLSWYSNNSSNCTRVWLMATANYQTYTKCQMKQPPLDVQWALQPVSVPSGGLGLSLNASSGQDSRVRFSLSSPSQDLAKRSFCEQDEILNCCRDCKANYEKESLSLHSINNGSAQLPVWLKKHCLNDTLVKDDLFQLRRKYNKMCQSLHQGSSHSNQSYVGRDYNCLSSSPSWPNQNRNSLIFADSGKISFANYPANQKAPSSLPRFRRQQSCHIEFSFGNRTSKNQTMEPKLDSLKGIDDKEVKITLALGNSTYKSDNDKLDLGEIFQENVPWQSENIPLILEALDQDKVVLIQGNDSVAKRRLAVGIAKSMFGSSDLLFHVGMRKKVNTAAHNREMLEKALRDHEKIVVLVEDVDHADPEFVEFLVGGYENGTFNNGHATFVLTTGGDHNTRCNKGKENMDYVIQMKLIVGDSNLDHKRKADDWDLPNRSKSPRNTINEIEEVISSNALDLNIKADDDDDDHDREDKQGELNRPVIPNKEQHSTSLGFLEKIKNRFVLNRNTDQEKRTRDMFLSKLKRSFEEVSGIASSFSVEERVLEDILQGSGLYLNNLFEQWLKQVFQTSLRVVDGGEWEKVCSIRLCLGEKSESTCQEDDGFMGTCLPKRIQVCLTG